MSFNFNKREVEILLQALLEAKLLEDKGVAWEIAQIEAELRGLRQLWKDD